MNKQLKFSLSKQAQKLILLHEEISSEEATIQHAAYMHIVMCQLGLPRSLKSIKDQYIFERQCGNCSIRIQAGSLWDGQRWIQQPLPYGVNPRLMLAAINRIAVSERTQVIDLGKSWSEFLRLLGKNNTSGGKTGNMGRLRQDLQSLLACEFKFGLTRNGEQITLDNKPVKEYGLWSTALSETGKTKSIGKIVLSDEYYSALVDQRCAVPFDLRAMHGLSHSALAIDIYLMLTERLHRLNNKQFLSWELLQQQFGHEYKGNNARKTFKNNFKKALNDVFIVYPACRAELRRKGISLVLSPPPIQKKYRL